MPVTFELSKLDGNLSRIIKICQAKIDYYQKTIEFLSEPDVPEADKIQYIKNNYRENIAQLENNSTLSAMHNFHDGDTFIDNTYRDKPNFFLDPYGHSVASMKKFLNKLRELKSNAHSESKFESVSHIVDDVYDESFATYHINRQGGIRSDSDSILTYPMIIESLEDFCSEK